MTNLASEEAITGERRVKFRNKRWWGSMAGLILLAVLGIKGLEYIFGAKIHSQFKLDPQFAIAVSVLVAAIILLTAFIYHRIIDEQEERAALWGVTFGFYAETIGCFAWWFLARAGLVSPFSFIWVVVASAVVAAAVQLWLQYR